MFALLGVCRSILERRVRSRMAKVFIVLSYSVAKMKAH